MVVNVKKCDISSERKFFFVVGGFYVEGRGNILSREFSGGGIFLFNLGSFLGVICFGGNFLVPVVFPNY